MTVPPSACSKPNLEGNEGSSPTREENQPVTNTMQAEGESLTNTTNTTNVPQETTTLEAEIEGTVEPTPGPPEIKCSSGEGAVSGPVVHTGTQGTLTSTTAVASPSTPSSVGVPSEVQLKFPLPFGSESVGGGSKALGLARANSDPGLQRTPTSTTVVTSPSTSSLVQVNSTPEFIYPRPFGSESVGSARASSKNDNDSEGPPQRSSGGAAPRTSLKTTPSTATPSTATPPVVTPSTATHSAATPSTATLPVVTPSTATPSAGTATTESEPRGAEQEAFELDAENGGHQAVQNSRWRRFYEWCTESRDWSVIGTCLFICAVIAVFGGLIYSTIE